MTNPLILLISLFTVIHSALAVDSIKLRDGKAAIIQCSISSGSVGGLRFIPKNESGSTETIPWSQIQSLQSSKPRPTLQKFLEQGELLWRAQIRLKRGDVILAQPLFERVFSSLKSTKSFDARLAAEGLLRCNLANGNVRYAVEPWLVTAKLAEAGIQTAFPELSPVIDDTTFLCPNLPPVWISDHSHLKTIRAFTTIEESQTSRNALALIAAATDEKNDLLQNHFLHQLFFDTELLKSSDTLSNWQEIWVQYFQAIKLLGTAKSGKRDRALLNLAIVAANAIETQPWLACAAMLRLSDELQIDGNHQSALRIKDDAIRLFPSHPLHQHDEFQIRNSSQ